MSAAIPPLPRRPASGHKGTFGTVAVVGGSHAGGKAMIGAPALAALGALRAGAGLARLVMPEGVLTAGLSVCPSATGVAIPETEGGRLDPAGAPIVLDGVRASCDALVIGPGLGVGEVERALCVRAVQDEGAPVVVDADALTNLSDVPDLFRDFHARAVLTPHPGEFRRLAGSLRISPDPASAGTRPLAAEALAQRLGCVVVLKGAGTVVTDGHATWVCERGHACLGTAGTGDVLAGVIGGLAAQFARGASPAMSLRHVAMAAVQAHAIAGERWAASRGAEAGLLAVELAELIPHALEELRA